MIGWAYWLTATALKGARVVKTSIGRHFETVERTFSQLACESYPPPPYSRRIVIELQKLTFKPTFYQKVLAEFGLQNWYPQNFAIDPWRHLLGWEPDLLRQLRLSRRLWGRKAWEKNLTTSGQKTGSKFFVLAPFLLEPEILFWFSSTEL